MALTVDTSTPKSDASDLDTPTRLRDDRGVNSPRKQKDYKLPPSNLITSVQRPGEGGKQTMSNADTELTDTQRELSQEGVFCGGCCAQKHMWMCGGSRYSGSTNAGATDKSDVPMGSLITETPVREESPEPSVSSSEELEGLLEKMNPKGRKCLVLDLDETLVHSSFKPVVDADFIVPVEIDGVVYKVYVLKRPHVDEFLLEVAKHYEIVVFTASLSLYANPLLDMLDKSKVIEHRLFREACVLHGQAYVKDLKKLGRKLSDTIIVDNSPLSYAFQPTSAVPITSWFDDRSDTQLKDLIPVLCTTLKEAADVRDVLDANNKSFKWLCQKGKAYDMSNFE